jgi:hypothetical protein
MSFLEKTIDSFLGIFIAWAMTMALLPWIYGFETSAKTSAEITLIYTVPSIARGYLVRRFFNWIN